MNQLTSKGNNTEEFEIIRSDNEITKLSAEKEIQLMKEREKVELFLNEIESLMREKAEQEKTFNMTKKKMMKSLAECQEIINQLMKEGAQKNKDEKEIKEQLRQSREDNTLNEQLILSLRNNLRDTESKLQDSQKKVLDKESQIVKLKIEISIYRDLSCKRDKNLRKEISEISKEKRKIQSWSEDLAMENEELRASKEIAQTELKRVIAVLQKRVLTEFLEQSKRLALPPSETQDSQQKEERDLILCLDQENLKEENFKLQRINNQLKQQLCEAQFELNNVDIQSYLVMLENQVDLQCSDNQSLERKEILKKSVYLTLTGIRQLCDHREIDMEFTI